MIAYHTGANQWVKTSRATRQLIDFNQRKESSFDSFGKVIGLVMLVLTSR